MDFRQLQVFRAVVFNKGFTRAGEDLHLSQSSVSLHVKHLEEELGCALFRRAGKRVMPTNAGRLLLSYTDRIFHDLENAVLAVREVNSIQRGTIRLGTGQTTLMYRLPAVLVAYRKKFPEMELFVESGTTEFMVNEIKNRRLDLAVAQLPITERGIEIASLGQEELAIIVPHRHPASGKREVEPTALAQMSFILYKKQTAMESLIERYCRTLGVDLRVAIRMDSPEAIKSMVRAGLGASIVPASAISNASWRRGLQVVRIKGRPLFRELVLLSLDSDSLPNSIREMKAFITDALKGDLTADIPKAGCQWRK